MSSYGPMMIFPNYPDPPEPPEFYDPQPDDDLASLEQMAEDVIYPEDPSAPRGTQLHGRIESTEDLPF